MSESTKWALKIDRAWLAARCIEDADCHLWTMACNQSGQPTYTFKDRGVKAGRQMRRIVWEMTFGAVESWGNRVVTTTCGHANCLNPAHLKVTTKRAVITKTSRRPEVRAKKFVAQTRLKRGTMKLTMDQARYVRDCDKTLTEIAAEVGISVAWASRIRRGEVWREIAASPFAGLGA